MGWGNQKIDFHTYRETRKQHFLTDTRHTLREKVSWNDEAWTIDRKKHLFFQLGFPLSSPTSLPLLFHFRLTENWPGKWSDFPWQPSALGSSQQTNTPNRHDSMAHLRFLSSINARKNLLPQKVSVSTLGWAQVKGQKPVVKRHKASFFNTHSFGSVAVLKGLGCYTVLHYYVRKYKFIRLPHMIFVAETAQWNWKQR